MKRQWHHEGSHLYAQEVLPRGCQDLCNAIVTQAAADYIKALKFNIVKGPQGVKQLEKFFRSKWYRDLTDIDGEWLMEKLRKALAEGNAKYVKHADPTAAAPGHGNTGKRKRKHKPGTIGGYEKIPLIEKLVKVGRRSV